MAALTIYWFREAKAGKGRARPRRELEPEPVNNSSVKDKDEEVASQVLTSMYLVREIHLAQTTDIIIFWLASGEAAGNANFADNTTT